MRPPTRNIEQWARVWRRDRRHPRLARLLWRSVRLYRVLDERDLGYLDIGGESGGA